MYQRYLVYPSDTCRALKVARLKLTEEALRLASVVAHDDIDEELVRRATGIGEECWPIEWEEDASSIYMALISWRNACRGAGYAVSSYEGQPENDQGSEEEDGSGDGLQNHRPIPRQQSRLPSTPLAASPSLCVIHVTPSRVGLCVGPSLLVALLCAWVWYFLTV